MKTRIMQVWALGLAIAGLPFAGGCAEQASTAQTTPPTTNAAPPAAAATAAPPAPPGTNVVSSGEEPLVRGEVADKVQAETRPAPEGLYMSPSFKEILKMVNGGVEEEVLLSFITNSAGMFNLGSEQIIYLNDLGVSSAIITAMIRNDQDITTGAKLNAMSSVPTPASPATPAGPTSFFTTPEPPAAASAAAPAAPAEAAPQYAPAPASPAAAPAPVASAPPADSPTTAYFYNELAPYGNWVNVEGYGWCWQPTVTVIHAGWRPYFDRGRWVYTDCGWYWHSDYSWGGIAFHYGRWFHSPRWGWCWWPDRVWGPSWVSWRYTDAYCGWAPLPPYACYSPGLGFTYYGSSVSFSFGFGLGAYCYGWVPWGSFCSYYPYRYAVCGAPARDIYHHSRPANHYDHRGHGANPRIVNEGPGLHKVQTLARSEVRRGTVRDYTVEQGGHRATPDRVSRERDNFVIHRPTPGGGGSSAVTPVAGGGRERPGSNLLQSESRAGSPSGSDAVTRVRPGGAPPRGASGLSGSTLAGQPAPGQSPQGRATRVAPTAPGSQAGEPNPAGAPNPRSEPGRSVTRVRPSAPTSPTAGTGASEPTTVVRPTSPTGRGESRAVETRDNPRTVSPGSPGANPPGTPRVVAPRSSSELAQERSGELRGDRPLGSPQRPAPRVAMPSTGSPLSGTARPSAPAAAAPPTVVRPSPSFAAPQPSRAAPPPSAPMLSYSAPSRPSYAPSGPASPSAPVVRSAPPSAPVMRSTPSVPSTPAPSMSATRSAPAPAPSVAPAPSHSLESRGGRDGGSPNRGYQPR